MRLEEPASSAATLSSLQNLDKEINFTNQFLMEKSQEDEPEKTNTEAEIQSLVTVPIHQDTSSVPLMTTPVIDLTVSQPASTMVQASLPTSTVTTTITTTTLPPPPPQPQQGISNSIIIQRISKLERSIADQVDANQALEERLDKQGNKIHQLETQDLSRMIREQKVEYIDKQEIDRKIEETVKEAATASVQYAMRAPLRAHFKDLPTFDMKEILLQRMLEGNYDKGHEDHRTAYEALQKSILRDESEQFDADKAEKRKKMKSKQDSSKTPPGSPPLPPPPPPPFGASGASGTTGISDSAQYPLPPPPSPTTNPDDQSPGSATPGLVQDMVSDDEDIDSRHIPKVNLNQDWFKPLSEDKRPATPEPAWSIPSSSLPVPIHNWASAIASSYVPPLENSLLSQTGDIGVFIDWFCKKKGITELTPKHLEGPAYEVVKAFHPNMIHLKFQMEECHKLLTNQVDDRLLRDLDYLRFGGKGDRLALSITKMKAFYYPDVGLEQIVLDQMWIEEECMYDISATYGISHWWFKRQKFYIDRHSAETNRRAIVRTHMRIVSVVSIDVFSIYGYDYMKQIVLRRADNQEYTIAENNFKDLYPSDFKDLYLLNLQGHLNHLPPRENKILSSAVNLWIRNLVIRQRVEDFQLGIENDHALQRNPQVQFWTTNDVIKSKQFMFAIQKRLNLRIIFRNLESFVGGRIREKTINFFREQNDDIFSVTFSTSCVEKCEIKGIVQTEMELVLEHTQQGDSDVYALEDPKLMLEILSRRFFLRLNLPDHRSVLTDSKVHIKMETASTCSSRIKFIATCSYSRLNDFTTSRKNDLKLPQL
ncbi:hypothetical protein Tco_0870821 [Tanacetum coccineum]